MVRPAAVRRAPRQQPRPRYGRLVAAGAAGLVTVVAALGGLGVLADGAAGAGDDSPRTSSDPGTGAVRSGGPAGGTGGGAGGGTGGDTAAGTAGAPAATSRPPGPPPVPAGSGSGRRVVFDMASQRVWLVGRQAGRDVATRSYLVSGSVTDNLGPGSYRVYSRSSHAVGIDDSGTMRYMVRFTRGENAAIGFHDIPVLDGRLVQTRDQLGTPQSHGCIRQWRPDARALWAFAPVGTRVVVT